jgi:hypothetical protein
MIGRHRQRSHLTALLTQLGALLQPGLDHSVVRLGKGQNRWKALLGLLG